MGKKGTPVTFRLVPAPVYDSPLALYGHTSYKFTVIYGTVA